MEKLASAASKIKNTDSSDSQERYQYALQNRPIWQECDANNYSVFSQFEPLLKADAKTQEELEKLEINADNIIKKCLRPSEFVSYAIFYDVSRQAHYKLIKLKGQNGDSNEWEAERIMVIKGDDKKNNQNAVNKQIVREIDLREFITILI